jgi:hypothetical protein
MHDINASHLDIDLEDLWTDIHHVRVCHHRRRWFTKLKEDGRKVDVVVRSECSPFAVVSS